ncbi:MAG: energy-coupling factor transporter transmembrane component T family protein, partial [Desulfomonilaceae bacterium]
MKSSDYLLGGYIPGTSPIHRLEPRVKLVSFLLMIIAVFVSPDFRSLTLSACVTLFVGLMANLGRRTWLAAFYRFSWLLILVFALNLVFYRCDAQTIATGLAISCSPSGVWKAIGLTAQLSMGIALSVVLTATTMPTHLIQGMVALTRPLKRIGLPIEEAATITYLALRFTPILQEEILAIVEAQKS